MRNIYGDRTDELGRPTDTGDASHIDGRTTEEAAEMTANPWNVEFDADGNQIPMADERKAQ